MKVKLDENFGTRTQHVFPQETSGIVVNGTTGNCVGSVSSSRRQIVRSLRKASLRFTRDSLSLQLCRRPPYRLQLCLFTMPISSSVNP
jgi:hypothetical protein